MPIKSIKSGISTRPLGFGLGAAETEETDPNFNQTILLLHSDGSEGEGNTSALGSPNYKAFRDNSTSAHAITVQGNAYGNDFSPYYYADGYWSNLFDGANDYVKPTSTSSDFNLGTGQFTFEAFIYTFITTQQTVMIASGVTDFNIYINGGKLYMYFGSNIINGVGTINVGQWHHIVVQRDGSNYLTAYVDGTRVYYTTQATDYTANNMITIGEHTNGTNDFNGYISNVRFVASTAVYSGASFTVPTTPLTAITNTKLLTCQSNRFIDNSASSHALTIGGDPEISTNTPFTQSKTANVGSGFFDGTGDELEITNSSDFAFGTGDFQISLWVYLLENSGGLVGLTGGTLTGYWCLTANGGTLYFQKAHNATDVFSTTLPSLHAWHFIEVSRVSGTTKMFIDGVQTNTASDTTDYNQTGQTLDIGDHGNHGEPKGYIADVRIIKGSGVTSSTLPTTSLTAVTNTKLLTCQYSGAVRNVGFVDDSKYNHPIIRNGDVSLGTFSPFSLEDGYWSSYHVSNSGYYFPHSSDYNLGSGEFTLEFWMYTTTITGTQYICGQVGSGGSGSDTAIQVYITGSSGQLELYVNAGAQLTSPTSSISANTWHFVSCVRQSNTLRMYIDGVQVVTGAFSATVLDSGGGFGVGQTGEYVGDGFKGYISNLRFVVGSCLRDDGTTFSVPTTPLTSTGSETKILTAQSNRFVDNSPTGRTATTSNTPKVIPFSPFTPSRAYTKDAVGGSAFFDGTGDSLKIEPQNDKDVFNPYSLSYTLEMWLYVDVDTPGTRYILGKGGTAAGWSGTTGHYLILFYYSGGVYLQWKTGAGSFAQLNVAHGSSYQWNHFAIGYDGTTVAVWWNGARFGTSTTAPVADTATDGDSIYLGVSNDGSTGPWAGYISNVRYVRGTDIYGVGNASITVPTSAPTAVTNTQFLTTFTNAGIIDHTMKTNLETTGNTRIRTDVKKFGTGSIYLDGSDELNVPAGNKQIDFGTGQFTVEAFIRVESGSGSLGQWFTNEGEAGSWVSGGIAVYLQSSFTVWVNDASSGSNIMSYDGNYDDGVMRHYVWVRGTSGAMALFVDGTRRATYTWTGTVGTDIGFTIGNYKGGSRNLTGFIDEMRITKGVARYDPSQSSVTVPTKAFANR